MKLTKILPLILLAGCSKFETGKTQFTAAEPVEMRNFSYVMAMSTNDSRFTHIATIPPHVLSGKTLQATGFASKDQTAYVVYNTKDDEIRGGLDVLSISALGSPQLISSIVSEDSEYAEVKEKDGHLFMVGQKKGVDSHNAAVLTVMNVTNPSAPVLASEVLFADGYYGTSIDIEGNLAYITVPNLGVKVMDISNPLIPVEVKTEASLPLFARRLQNKTIALGGSGELKVSALGATSTDLHKIDTVENEAPSRFFLNENVLYSNAAGKLTILDLANLSAPALRSQIPLEGRGNGLSEHACLAYLAQGEKGLSVYDVKNKVTPSGLGSFDYADDSGSANNTYLMQTGLDKTVFVSDGKAGVKIVKVQADVMGCEEKGGPGLLCKIYQLPVNTAQLPNFSTMTPVGQFVTEQLDVTNRNSEASFPYFPQALKTMKEWYGISCEGDVIASETGTYTTSLTSDDGSKLYVDGVLLIDNDSQHNVKTVSKTQARVKGQKYHVKVDYFQGPKNEIALEVKDKSPTGTAQYLKGFNH